MIFLIVLGGVAIVALIFGPQYWVQTVMARHSGDRPDFPGTGGELARYLLDQAGLHDVQVEETPPNTDHYDPLTRAVRLAPNNFGGRSVTAVAIAAHEVSHAVQHRDGDRFLMLRTRWAGAFAKLDKFAFWTFLSIPLVSIIVKSPFVALIQVAAIVVVLGGRVFIHLLTLPTELDASFKRALPALEQGGLLSCDDLTAARSVLRAAAGTYVAGALATLLDVIRWIR